MRAHGLARRGNQSSPFQPASCLAQLFRNKVRGRKPSIANVTFAMCHVPTQKRVESNFLSKYMPEALQTQEAAAPERRLALYMCCESCCVGHRRQGSQSDGHVAEHMFVSTWAAQAHSCCPAHSKQVLQPDGHPPEGLSHALAAKCQSAPRLMPAAALATSRLAAAAIMSSF